MEIIAIETIFNDVVVFFIAGGFIVSFTIVLIGLAINKVIHILRHI